MKDLQYILLLIVVGVIGCTFNYPYMKGMKYNQFERLSVDMKAGKYYKSCIFTTFTNPDNYTYNCSWNYATDQ